MQTDIEQPNLPGPARLALITASDAEAAHIYQHCKLKDKITQPPGTLWYGRCRTQDIVLLRCGIGPERAIAGFHWLQEHCRLWGVLTVGFAGGLQPKLATGDAVWVTRMAPVENASSGRAPDLLPDCTLTALMAEAAGCAGLIRHRGPLLSSVEVIHQATAKRELGTQSGALAVDMESYSLAREAARFRLPFASMRTIFDTCHDDLLFPVDICTTQDGRLRYGRLAAYIARYPHTLLDLPRLGFKARLAGQYLRAWLDHFFAILDQQAIHVQPRTSAPILRLRDVDIEFEADKP